MKRIFGVTAAVAVIALSSCCSDGAASCPRCGATSGELTVTNAKEGLHSNYPDRIEKLSEAMRRNLEYEGEYPMESELYTTFKYTVLEGFDYNGGDGTRSRRDPSKVIFENGKYYVWYTHRNTIAPPNKKGSDVIPYTDWDLSEIWYATSKDGFKWEEQGVAITHAPKPEVGCRSVSTADILKFEGKFYLYYQSFLEPEGGVWRDVCPVSVSVADSPDGPWTRCGQSVVPKGAKGEWDENLIHDPFPMVHNGKIYLYYKSGYNHRDAGGLAIADRPEGPFMKCPQNPVLNSGHEVSLFPFREGVAAMVIKAGNEHNTIQYAEDWVNFKIASFVNIMPNAPAGFIADAFTDTKNGRGITWGMCHFLWQGKDRNYSVLDRFDCDLSLDVNDPQMKAQVTNLPREIYLNQKLSPKQRARIKAENDKLMKR
ncbi:MAG: family 43 glycosylhydrolase [Rikenellaceae bacterium]